MADEKFEELLFGDDNQEKPEDNIVDQTAEPEPEETEDDVIQEEEEQEPDGEETPVEPDKEKQVGDTNKFYQEQYQRTLAKLKERDPVLYTQVKNELKAERKPEYVQPHSKPQDNDDDELALLNRTVESAAERAVQKVMDSIQKQQQEIAEQRQVAEERYEAEKLLAEYIETTKFPKEQLESIFEEVRALNIDINRPGGSNAAAKAMIKEIMLWQLQGHMKESVVKAQAEAIDKAQSLKSVAQPVAGASPTPRAKTKEEKMLETLKAQGTSAEAQKVFG